MSARLAVLATALLASLGLAVPSPALAAPLDKTSLLTLDEAETVYPQLRGRHDDGQARRLCASGSTHPTSRPRRCTATATATSAAPAACEGYYYSLSGPSFALDENIIQLRTTAEARAVLAHYRAFIEACHGTTRRPTARAARRR